MARTGRPRRKTVDYFQHDVTHGKTLFILESKWGNDGYAFWWKLLEQLGNTDGHFLDLNKVDDWEFLQGKCRTDEHTTVEILNKLAELDAIDRELWSQKIVWCQNFVDRIAIVYRLRTEETPQKPTFHSRKSSRKRVSTVENPHSIVEYSIEENSIEENNNVHPPSVDDALHNSFQQFWSAYPRKEGKKPCWNKWQKLRPSPDMLGQILCAIEQQKRTEKWRKENGKYIPMPLTWLNQERWTDEVENIPKERDLPIWT